jgi:hypothetical protein
MGGHIGQLLTAPRKGRKGEPLHGIHEYAPAAHPTLAPNQYSAELAAERADM